MRRLLVRTAALVALAASALGAAPQADAYDLAIARDGDQPLYHTLVRGTDAAPAAWVVYVDYTPDCRGTHACAYLAISGSPGVRLPAGKPAVLRDGTRAVYRPPMVAAYCSDARLSFVRRGQVVTIAASCAPAARLIALAESLHPRSR